MLPMSYYMDPLPVMVLMLRIYTGGMYGSSILDIDKHLTHRSASAFDGYPLNKQGKGLLALLLALISSVIGGFIGIVCLLFFLNILGIVVLKLGHRKCL